MKGIIEYLKLLPKALSNPEKIIEGIINDVKLKSGTLPEDEQEEIIRRRLICETCPFNSELAKTNAAINYKSDRTDFHCSICQCNIDWKTACLECNCGLETHNAKNPDAPIALKWTRYIKKPNNEQDGKE